LWLNKKMVAMMHAEPSQSSRPNGTFNHSTATTAAESGSAQANKLVVSGPIF
jgi:hypothetical protein